MPDFENDEIRDSSFPVEFNDETEALDMYGVWVKSGPRDVSSLEEEDESGSAIQVAAVLPVFNDVPDISEFDELPDIEDFDAEENESDQSPSDSVSDELTSYTSFELPDFDTAAEEDTANSADTGDETAEIPEIAAENDDFEFGAISFGEGDSPDEPVLASTVEEQPVSEEGTGEDTFSDLSFDVSALDEAAAEMDDFVPDEDFLIDSEIEAISDAHEGSDIIEEIASFEISDNEPDAVSDTAPEPEIVDFDTVLEGFDDEPAEGASEESVLEEELEISVDPDAVQPDFSGSRDDTVRSGFDTELSESETDAFAELSEESADGSDDSFDELVEEFEESDEIVSESFGELADESAQHSPANPTERSATTDKAADDTLADLDPDLANFSMEDFAGIADMINAEKGSSEAAGIALPEEDDFSSLLDDINSGSASPVSTDSSGFDDLDLDDFINEINDSGGSTEKEKEKLFSDVDPVDIDLEFDEEFIENSEKIRATGSLISEAEFENSEFGVEFVDETGSGDELDGYESFDSSIFPAEEDTTRPVGSPVPSREDDTLEIASEFDDLLASLDSSRPAAPGASGSQESKVHQDFNLQVTDEDGLDSVVNEAPQMNDGDDFNVPLFSESPGAHSGEELQGVEDDVSVNEDLSIDIEEPAHVSVDLSSFEEFVPDNDDLIVIEESVPENAESDETDLSEMIEFESDSMISDESPLLEEETSSSSIPSDSHEDTSENDEEFSVLDTEDTMMEIVEKDNLEITGESDYNEYQSGISDSDNGGISIDFDDVGAFEESLHEPGIDTGETDVTSNDKSTELLMLIAEELSSIKRELSTLNSELSTTMKPVLHGDDSSPDSVVSDSTDNTGFFSDDDTDETIALTGDELNNILITADFTEEKTGEPEVDDFTDGEDSASITDFSVDESDESDESGEDVTADFNPVEDSGQFDEIAFDDEASSGEPEELDIPDVLTEDEMFGTNEIKDDVEVSYVNKVDEDVSYLEGGESVEPDLENVAIEESDIETLDFNDENLEEPELTEFNIDFSAMEDSIGVVTDEPAGTGSEPFFSDSDAEFEEADTVVDEPVIEAMDIGIPAVSEEPDNSGVDTGVAALPVELKEEIKSVLSYMDQLLESLPEEKIEEFARSEHFEVYKKLFEELGIT